MRLVGLSVNWLLVQGVNLPSPCDRGSSWPECRSKRVLKMDGWMIYGAF